MSLPFRKMQSLGNDFVIIEGAAPDGETIRRMGDRRRGIGFDQLLVLDKLTSCNADLFMRIYNPDGSEAGACGNGTRCVARYCMDTGNQETCVIETTAGLLASRRAGEDIEVDMGPPRLDWQSIPLASACDTLHLHLIAGLPDAVAVNMGNPHAVFFMDDVDGLDIAGPGAEIERHPMFPDRTNVEFAQVLRKDQIRMRVWERAQALLRPVDPGLAPLWSPRLGGDHANGA